MGDPDFNALRAERNLKHAEWVGQMKAEGWNVSHCHHDEKACYCDCGRGGPCEHDWNGDTYESPDGLMWSTTCSKCGETSYSHSMRNCP